MTKNEQYTEQTVQLKKQLRQDLFAQLKRHFPGVSEQTLEKIRLSLSRKLDNLYILKKLGGRLSELDSNVMNLESSFSNLINSIDLDREEKDKKQSEKIKQLTLNLVFWLKEYFPYLPKSVSKKIKALKNFYVVENLEQRLSNLAGQNSINLEAFIPIFINKIQLEEIEEIYKIYQTTKSPLLTAEQLIESDRRIMNEFAVDTNIIKPFENYQKSSTIQKLYDSGRITWSGIYGERGTDIVELEKKLLEKSKLTIDQLELIWIESKRIIEDYYSVIRNIESTDLENLESERQKFEEKGYSNPTGIEDARKKIIASIVQRQGQPEFRRKLLAAYENRCPITGCDSEHAIEAAHISPYNGPDTNNVTNGLPLRADIHTLFDLHLLSIEPNTYEVKIASKVLTTCYQELDGRKLTLPKNKIEQPDKIALQEHYESFLRNQK